MHKVCFPLVVLAASAALAAGAQKVVLVDNSQAKAAIVLGSKASQDERDAARELVEHIRLATGAKLPVAEAVQSGSGATPRIIVGLSACPPAIRARVTKLKADSFVIESLRGDDIVLAGQPPNGTSFAVYAFLEKAAGIRWLWPGESGTVIPKSKSLAVAPLSLQKEPAFLWRFLGPGGALWGPADKWTKERELGVTEQHQREQELWEKRNGYGGLRAVSGHSFGKILPPAVYGPKQPELFALTGGVREWENFDGKHRKQPCTTNPEVIRITIDYCRNFFDAHPDYGMVSIQSNDGRGFCECERCQRLDTGKTQEGDLGPNPSAAEALRIISDRMITFGNQVAEAVARTHPGKKVLIQAYGQTKQPPERVKASSNLVVQYTLRAAGHWNPETEQRDFQVLEAWKRQAPAMGIYEYIDQVNFANLPRLFPELIGRSVARLDQLGYRYYETQAGSGHATNGLNYYVLARVLWDPSADVRAIERDYIEKGFGAAAPAVTRYFNRLAAQWKQEGLNPTLAMKGMTLPVYRAMAAVYPKNFRDACRRDLAEALTLARGEDRSRVEFLQRGFHYMDLTGAAIDATIPLFEAGWKFSPQVALPAGADMKQFRQALAAWETRDSYVESRKNQFELAYLWICQNTSEYGFNPRAKMRQFAAATTTEKGK